MSQIVTLRLDISGTSHTVPTFENSAIQITKRVADIDSLSSQGQVTKQTFRVPLGEDLIKAIGDITDLGQDALVNINESIKGYILINSFPRFTGSFQIIRAYKDTQSGSKEVELAFVGNETDLKTELTKVKMSDMFDGEYLDYSAAEIDLYLDSPFFYRNNYGYMWPLVDYGFRYTADPNASEGTILDPSVTPLSQFNFKPSVSLEKCFEMMPVDITFDSSLDELMRYTILLHNSSSVLPELDTSPKDYTGYMDRSSAGSQLLTPNVYSKIAFNREVNYNQDQIDLPNDEYDIPLTGGYTFRVKGDIVFSTTNVGSTSPYFFIKLADAGVVGGGLLYAYNPSTISSGNPTTVSLDFTYRSFHTAGQAISLQIMTAATNTTIAPQIDFRFEVVESPNVIASSQVDIAANCPELTAWDILRGVSNMCNGIIQSNSDGTYNIIPWVEWIDDNTDLINLNERIEEGTIQIEPFSVKGAKKIRLTYLDDEDFYNQKYKELEGNVYGTLLIEDTGTDFTNKEFKVELPWAATVPVPIESTNCPIPKLYDSEYKTIKGKPRLLQNTNFEYANLSFSLQDVFGGTIYSYTQIPNMSNWSAVGGGYNELDSNFGKSLTFFSAEGYPNNNLYNKYWKRYIEETYTQEARKVTAKVALTQTEIDGLEFNEQFYYQNAKLRLTALNNINVAARETVQAELMKRITIENVDLAPFYPYDVINGIVQWNNSTTNADLGDASGQSAPDVLASAKAYGFFYDSNLNIAVERGQILEV